MARVSSLSRRKPLRPHFLSSQTQRWWPERRPYDLTLHFSFHLLVLNLFPMVNELWFVCACVFFFFLENRRRRLMRASTTGLPSSWRAASTHLGTRPCSNLSEARKVCFIFWVFFSYLWRWFEIRRLLIFWNFWCVYSLIFIWFWTDGKLIHGRKIDPHFQQLSTTEEIWDRVLCHACKGWRSPLQWK